MSSIDRPPAASPGDPVRVCFVCLGNICRSPTAEGIFRHLVAERRLQDRIEVDSAGTGGWHAGQPPDERAQQEAARRGVDLSGLRARQVNAGDVAWFDLLVGMDRQNMADLADLAPDAAARQRMVMLGEFHPEAGSIPPEVGDPYYGDGDGFAQVFDLITESCAGLLDHLQRSGRLPASG
ncbi:MAG: low molecular weight phosphotyrosine protein phosphatase [Acidimicrobiia bacterium]|nr:low molecular weight phosphotyrosine protein phosphatase [Acidimicrobiia bacterium]